MGEKTFTKVQIGQQAAFGTAVAATRRLMCKVDPGKDRTVKFPEDPLGIRARSYRSRVDQIHAGSVRVSTDNAYYQLLPLLFELALKGGVTPSEQTADQDDWLWDFTPDLTGDNSPVPSTLEYGDDTQAYEISDFLGRRIVIEGNVGEDAAVSVEVEGFGKQIDASTFTVGLTPPTIEPMVANMAKLWIDANWAGLGGTQKTGLLRKYRIEILTGVHPKFWAEGVKTMTGFAESVIDVMWTLTFEGNADADTLWDAYNAETAKALRLEILGSKIGTGETHSLTIDTYGKFEEVIPLGDEKDGNNLHTALFHGISDNEATPHMLAVKVSTDINEINPS